MFAVSVCVKSIHLVRGAREPDAVVELIVSPLAPADALPMLALVVERRAVSTSKFKFSVTRLYLGTGYGFRPASINRLAP